MYYFLQMHWNYVLYTPAYNIKIHLEKKKNY